MPSSVSTEVPTETSMPSATEVTSPNSSSTSHVDNKPCSPRLPECGYTVLKRLGQGVFSEVFLAHSKDGRQVALKKLPKNNATFSWKSVQNEIKAGSKLSHDNVIKFREFFETVSNVYLVFEYVNDGLDLFSYMDSKGWNLPENVVKHICRQMVESLLYCHSQGVVHRDIKLENVLIDQAENVKLIDFGLCDFTDATDKQCHSFVGSPEYAAPEILLEKPYSGFKSDVWSCGIVLYSLLFGEFPFTWSSQQRFVLTGRFPSIQWPKTCNKQVDESAKELISQMLQVDPKQRISLQQVATHKWLTTPITATA